MTLTYARGFKLFKLSRRWTNKNKTREGPNNFSTAMTRKNLTVTWTRLVGSKKDQKINTTSGKMKGGYICPCKAQKWFLDLECIRWSHLKVEVQ